MSTPFHYPFSKPVSRHHLSPTLSTRRRELPGLDIQWRHLETNFYLPKATGLFIFNCFKILSTFPFSWDASLHMCLVTHLCLTLCDPKDHSSPGSSVHGISQARIQKWDAISFSRLYIHDRQQSSGRDDISFFDFSPETLPLELGLRGGGPELSRN